MMVLKVRKNDSEREKKKECDRQLLAPQHPQTLSSEIKKKKRKTQQETVFF